jgi:hypothetical protein
LSRHGYLKLFMMWATDAFPCRRFHAGWGAGREANQIWGVAYLYTEDLHFYQILDATRVESAEAMGKSRLSCRRFAEWGWWFFQRRTDPVRIPIQYTSHLYHDDTCRWDTIFVPQHHFHGSKAVVFVRRADSMIILRHGHWSLLSISTRVGKSSL